MGVFLDVIDDVEGTLRLDVAGLRALSEGDAVHDVAALRVHELQLDVLLVAPHDLAGAVVIDLPCAEEGLRVVGSVGGEALDVGSHAAVDVAEVDVGIDVEYGVDLLGLYVLLDVLLEAVAEGRYVLCRHAQARGVGVTAEVLEQVCTALDGLIDVEPGHAAGRTGSHAVVVAGENHAGLVEDLRQARGHNADDAAVPLFVEEDDGLVLVAVLQCHDDAVGFLRHGLVQVLALLVVLVDLLGQLHGLLLVPFDEECYGLAACLHTSGCVDARPYLEDDVPQGNLPAPESAHLHERLDAGAGSAVELAQAVVGQDAVLAHDGHDVGSDADGTEVEQGDELRELDAVVQGKSLNQLEANAAAAEVLVGVGVVEALGIEHSHSRRQLRARHVMIADDEVDALLLGIGNLVGSLDATVEHDDKPHARLAGIIDTLARDAVAVVVAVGNVIVYVAGELLQEAIHECHCRATIHIVVAIDEDALLASEGFVEAVHGLLHVLKEERVVQVGELRTEELTRILHVVYAATYQHTGQHRADLQLCCHLTRKLQFCFRRRNIAPLVVHCLSKLRIEN